MNKFSIIFNQSNFFFKCGGGRGVVDLKYIFLLKEGGEGGGGYPVKVISCYANNSKKCFN